MISSPRLLTIGLAVMALGVLASCGSDEDSSDSAAPATAAAAVTQAAPVSEAAPTTVAPTGSTTAAAPAGGATLTIAGFAFSPLTVAAGETIAITNNDTATHTVTDDAGSFDVEVGTTAELTISEAGTYAIHCEIHKDMKGTIVVE